MRRRLSTVKGGSKDAASAYEFASQAWQRRKWLAILAFCVIAAATFCVTLALPDLYRATASVLVERQQVSEAYVRTSVTAELETRIQTIHQQVMSRARLTDVINRLDLYRDLRDHMPIDAIVQRMRRDIQLELKGVDQTTGRTATIAFTLGYSGRDPETVALVANTLVGLYVDENTKSREQQASRTATFLKDQLAEVKRGLDDQERRANDFKMEHTGELPQQLEVNLAALERLSSQLRLNGEYQLRAIERRERFEKQLSEAASAEPDLPPSAPISKLPQLYRDLAELQTQFSDHYPDVIRVKAEIAALERQLAPQQAKPDSPKPVDAPARIRQALAENDAELASLKEQEKLLRQMIGGYEARAENAPKRQQELQDLLRDYETTKEHYQTLLKRYEDARLAATLEESQNVEQFRVLDPAIPPTRPAAPDRMRLVIMGLIAAIAFAFGVVLAAERLDTTFHTLEDLRNFTNAPTLATIRPIITAGDRRRQRRRVALIAVAAVVFVMLVGTGTYRYSAGNEQLVRMMTRGGD
jgi:polysaccharide chain length determinant protein (PEP-CTERM system associated)